jgi:hypothetical protein
MSTPALQDSVGSLHDNADVYREGREALDRISTARDWSDWQKVGAALAAGRTEAMRSANTNRPKGKKYNQDFGDVLKREHLDSIDSATRYQLLQIAENLPAIEEWREKLDPDRRLKLNHPSTIWRNWQRTVKGAGKKQADEVEQSSDEREDAAPVSIIAPLTTLVQQIAERGFTQAQLDDLLAAKPSFTSSDLIKLAAQLDELATELQEHANNPHKMIIEETSR